MTSLIKYVCSNIIKDIRSGLLIDSELIKQITNKEYMKYLRENIKDDDYQQLKKYLNSGDYNHKKFTFAILQKIKDVPEVKELVFNFWKKSVVYEDKWVVMFNLLDYQDLDEQLHINVFEFIKSNLERWLSDTCNFMTGGEDNKILQAVVERINDSDYPPTKDWVYLLISFSSPDKTSVLNLINKYQNERYPMNRKVKEMFLELYQDYS